MVWIMSDSLGAYTPRDYIITVYGAFVRGFGDWVAVADLLTLLEATGTELPAARSTITRLKKAGVLVSERRDGRAGYLASAEFLAVLADGDRRIFEPPGETEATDGWTIVLFSIPESQRDKRHIMRSRLAALGFGPVAPGAWIGPARASDDARRMLERQKLTEFASMFEGQYKGFDTLPGLVAKTWDLAPLGDDYRRFFDHHRETLERWQLATPNGSVAVEQRSDAFVDYIKLLQDWRQVVFRDPGMPDVASPFAQLRGDAFFLFDRLRSRLEAPAREFVGSVIGIEVI